MIPIAALWLPIVLSGVVVFVVSAMVWMVMPHHKKDFARVEDEGTFLDAIRSCGAGPGMYVFPWADGAEEDSAEYRERVRQGPVGILRVRDGESVLDMRTAMAKSLVLYLVVGVFVAFVASISLGAGAGFLAVFRITGLAAFMAHGFIGFQESIWFGLPGSVAFKHALDGLVYALLTASVFGWLWPA
ncbi:MAG: hypothetical protein OXE96_04500 [Gemmatimonadetes bacterium]|nr:hypothetical protein [Gemmatimonadota bacterium]